MKERKCQTCPVSVVEYDDIRDFLRYLRSPFPEGRQGNSSESEEKTYDWDSGLGFNGAMEAGLIGLPNLVLGLEQGARKANPMIKEKVLQYIDVRQKQYDIAGGGVEIGRYLSQRLDCMYAKKRQPKKRLLRFLICISAVSAYDSDFFEKRAAIIGAAIRALELRDYQIALDIYAGTENGSYHNVSIVRIKRPEDYLSPALLAFWTGHPAVLRRLFFCEREHWDVNKQRCFGVSCGYGRSWTAPKEITDNYDVTTEAADGERTASELISRVQESLSLIEA